MNETFSQIENRPNGNEVQTQDEKSFALESNNPSWHERGQTLVNKGKLATDTNNQNQLSDINQEILDDPDFGELVASKLTEKKSSNSYIENDTHVTEISESDLPESDVSAEIANLSDPSIQNETKLRENFLSEDEELTLRTALEKQFSDPLSYTSSEDDIESLTLFGLHGHGRSQMSHLYMGTRGRAERYFAVVKETYNKVAQEMDLPEIDIDNMIHHELQHFDKSSENGFNQEKFGYTIGFGRITQQDGNTFYMLDIGAEHDISEHYNSPLESAEVDLAPDDPSPKDLKVFLDKFKKNKEIFLQLNNLPRTIRLFRKFGKASNINIFQVGKILFS